jgi:hypothetical protein
LLHEKGTVRGPFLFFELQAASCKPQEKADLLELEACGLKLKKDR